MADKYIKAHCAKHDKWFALELDSVRGGLQVVNFVGMTKEEAQRIQTEVSGTSFRVAPTLRRCCKCGTDKVGTCSHTEKLTAGGTSMCDVAYSYQCLFCDQLRISGAKADTSRYSEWVGISNIPGATKDRFGNPQGSQYDLAKDGGFKGSKIVFMCLNRAVIVQLDCAIEALKRKGFEVDLFGIASPESLKKKLDGACQLWVLSDGNVNLNNEHRRVIRDYYERGGGLYILGDNHPLFADANKITQELVGVTMGGDTYGDRVIGVQKTPDTPGIAAGHPIATGIVNLYEGITIATVGTDKKLVRPLVISSDCNVVTACVDDGKHRMLIDGGFTRLFHKWDTAGTDRFVMNCAAWLAGGGTGGEQRFT